MPTEGKRRGHHINRIIPIGILAGVVLAGSIGHLTASPAYAYASMRGAMSPAQFSGGDFAALGQYGYKANVIRWQMTRNWGLVGTDRDINEYNNWLLGKLNELDSVLAAARANGMKVVVDLHTPPGGRYADTTMAMFYESAYNQDFLNVWSYIAWRFGDNPTISAYDLINEPTETLNNPPPAGMSSKETQTAAAQNVRMYAPDTPIIIEPAGLSQYGAGTESFRGFTPVTGISNLWYEVHVYNYDSHFVDGTACYPGPADGYYWNQDLLRAIISPVKSFQDAYAATIYVGEFSIPVGSCGAGPFLGDLIQIFEGYNWNWTYHAFREAPMWSMEASDRLPYFQYWFGLNSPA